MMKKLYGTTAIVALGLAFVAAAPAAAQAPAQGFSTSNFAVTIGGFARQFVSHTSTDNAAATVRNGVDQIYDNRLNLTFQANLPNSMVAGTTWNLNPQQDTATGNSITRRSFVFLQSNFGLLQLGNTEHVANQAHVTSYEAFTPGLVVNNQTAWSQTVTNGTASVLNSTGSDIDGISNKINYFTPRIEGFQAGASYIPEMSFRNGLPAAGVSYTDGLVGMANYVNTLGGVAIRASLGYQSWNAPSGVNMTDAQKAAMKDPSIFNAGIGLRFMGFDIGGSYAQIKDYRNLRGTAAGGALVPGSITVPSFMPAIGDLRSINGHVWEAGLGYIFGPAGVSVNYLSSENDNSTFSAAGVETKNANGKDKLRLIGVGGHYTMGPGVQAVAGYYNSRATDNGNGNFNGRASVTTSTFITGLALTF